VFIATFVYTFIQSPVFQRSLKLFKTLVRIVQKKKTRNQEGIVL